ncbi:MAG: hypothetical protein J6Z01_11315 [Bacteroidales bacterium]|nr:hypothetical protein [Bacteroidales bacterium]
MASVPEIILNNPFRVLGVYANSSYREIVASISKATKFMEVGRNVDYPLDLPKVKNLNVKSSLTHSLEDLDNALAVISNSEDRLKYAQFWFLRMTSLDDEAFDVLFSGKPNLAISVWNKEDNLSSLQNRIILYFWKGDFKSALQNAERLYKLFPDDFLKAVDSKGTLVKSANDLIQCFVDTLVSYIIPNELLDSNPSSFWLDYIVPTISDDTIAKINKAIQDAKDQLDILNNEGAMGDYGLPKDGIGLILVESVENELILLDRIFQHDKDNPRFQLIADNLGNSLANILYECAIDEYNKRNVPPDYSIALLINALELSNNTMDKEEINSKIQLFLKKTDTKNVKKKSISDTAITFIGIGWFILFFICIVFIIQYCR